MNAQVETPAKPATDAAVAKLTLMASGDVKKQQDGIRVSLVKLDAAIHENAVQCLLHAEKHGDTSLMRRLLVEIVDAKSGYRRQGIIAWMREFSPMELKGDVIQLTGTINGERRPFRVEEANATPFTELAGAKEMVGERPIFRDNLTSQIDRAIRNYRAAVENTVIEPGKPPRAKDPKKPFYDGIHLDKIEAGFDKMEAVLAEITAFPDATKDVYDARTQLKKAELLNETAAGK